MNYGAAISDFFKSPAWFRNVLLNAVCLMIPVAGMMVIQGWHISTLWSRRKGAEPSTMAPFDFDSFGVYLERGLWPTLVTWVATLVIMPIGMVLWVMPTVLLLQVPSISSNAKVAMAAILLAGGYFVLLAIMSLILTPLTVRATLGQDFAGAFDYGFVREFVQNTWKELLMVVVCLFAGGIVLMLGTVVTCYIGGVLGLPVWLFAWQHWQHQLYELHLERGGREVARSPKLPALPPPLPH